MGLPLGGPALWVLVSTLIPGIVEVADLISDIKSNINQNIYAPYGYGEVKNTGRIDTKLLLESYSNVLNNEKLISHESFEYDKLKISKKIVYKGIESENIIIITLNMA